MLNILFDHLLAELRAQPVIRRVGRIRTVSRGVIGAAGLGDVASVGDRVSLGRGMGGEIVALTGDHVSVLPDAGTAGLRAGDPVVLGGPPTVSPDDSWLGRVIDPDGRALDGRPLLRGPRARAVASPPPPAGGRRGLGPRLETGMQLFDTILPVARGQRVGLFAGPGVGKSTLMGRFALGLDADVIVIALVGERGRELNEFTRRILGPAVMARTVVVAATSDTAPGLRRRAAETAMAVAEHFRDTGRHVLLLIDSITRMAEAHREIALAAGEEAALRGHPASMVSRIAGLAERAGPGAAGASDITAVFTVLVAGSDMDEPVADTLRGLIDGHVVLDRRIADRGRFPAVDVTRSISRALPEAASDVELGMIGEARRLIGLLEDAELMLRSGLYEAGSDADLDRAVALRPRLEQFLSGRARGGVAGSFAALSAVLGGPAPGDGDGGASVQSAPEPEATTPSQAG